MRAVQPYATAAGTVHHNGDPISGSVPDAAFFNLINRELSHLVEYAGLALSLDDSDTQQVRKAVAVMIAAGIDLSAYATTQSVAGYRHGQCRLTLSGGNIVLVRANDKWLLINGTSCDIPAAGVSLAPTGLVTGMLYYIYAYMSGGTMTLEASATAHATDAATGVEVKAGDPSRTLVGMASPAAGPVWAADQVSSWFNRRLRRARGNYHGTTGSAVSVSLPGTLLYPMAWSASALVVMATCAVGSSNSGTYTGYTTLSVGGVDYDLTGTSLLAPGTQGASSGALTLTAPADGVIAIGARARVNSGTLDFSIFVDIVWEA